MVRSSLFFDLFCVLLAIYFAQEILNQVPIPSGRCCFEINFEVVTGFDPTAKLEVKNASIAEFGRRIREQQQNAFHGGECPRNIALVNGNALEISQ